MTSRSVKLHAPTVLDLFCGCGGISWGLKRSGFRILAGVDNDHAALETFQQNFPEARAFNRDLCSEQLDALPKELELVSGDLDVLVGGPPCQGFSKNVPRSGRYIDDPKNLLVRSFMRAVDLFRPKVVLMENVAEMANAFGGAFRDELLCWLDQHGYKADYDVHNVAEYGVPQRRRRVVFLANRIGVPVFIPARQCRVALDEGTHMRSKLINGAVSVWDAIGDLAPILGPKGRPNGYVSPPFSDFQRMMRSQNAPLTDHEERRLRPTQQARYNSLNPGEGLKELPDHLRPASGYSGAYGRLTNEMIAPTITRWVFHPGSGRFGHPVERRIITIREAARFQSFSDDFLFSGTNQQKSWQIGNAVPPMLVEALAPIMRCFLEGNLDEQARLRGVQQLSLQGLVADRL
ncbi:MAG: DNA cytosine methyltransferase [bacterium]|jgi:DNA (cytosine-5)-methyltransferase 1